MANRILLHAFRRILQQSQCSYFEVLLGVAGTLLLEDLLGVSKSLPTRSPTRSISEFTGWSLESFNIALSVTSTSLFAFRFPASVRKFFTVFFTVLDTVSELFADLTVWFEDSSFICEVAEVAWAKSEVVFFLTGVFNWTVGWTGANSGWKMKIGQFFFIKQL